MKDKKTDIVKAECCQSSGGHSQRGRCTRGENGTGWECCTRAENGANNGRSCMGTAFAIIGICISLFWVLNFSCGIFEIPDNIPIIGNLDEVFFTMLLLGSLSYLGFEIPFLEKLIRSRRIKK